MPPATPVTRQADVPPLTVLYDGDCPLCRREIAYVQRLSASHPESGLVFANIGASASCGESLAAERDALLAQFHVQQADGTRLKGARAFVAMWSRLPGWRLIARVARLPGVMVVLEASYQGFLRLRPTLQRCVRRFERPRGAD